MAARPRRLFRPVPLDPAGVIGPTKWQAHAGRDWVRTSRGLYVPADVERDIPEQRILEQSARAPLAAVVTGWAGCRLHGGGFFDGLSSTDLRHLPVPVNVGPRGYLAGDQEIAVCYGILRDDDLVTRYGVPTVAATRATYDAMRLATGMRQAVVALDMMAAAGRTSITMLAEYAARWATARDPWLLPAIALASEHSRSPMETRLRLIWVLNAALPAPLVNCDVWDLRGVLIGELDLFDPESGTAVEFDGDDHAGALRRATDAAKADRLREVDIEVARVTGPDMRNVDLVTARLVTARARSAFTPTADRKWTVRPKPDDLHRRIQEEVMRQTQHDAWLAEDRHRPG